MKKLAIASAIAAAAMVSAGAHASLTNGHAMISGGSTISTDCNTLPAGGTSMLTYTNSGAPSTLGGTICLTPTGGYPYIMLQFALGDSTGAAPTGSIINQGTITILQDWGPSSGSIGWQPYSTINASATNITCPGLTNTWTPSGSAPGTLLCSANLLGNPADLYAW